jgi:hypothetical protein
MLLFGSLSTELGSLIRGYHDHHYHEPRYTLLLRITTMLRKRIPIMALVFLALLAAMWGGLWRLGWRLPTLRPTLPTVHGPLMVSGFLGTLIGLERAVALSAYLQTSTKRYWVYFGPVVSALGAGILIIGVTGLLGPWLMTLGSLGLVAAFFIIIRLQLALFTVTMGLGALTWFIGNTLWLAERSVYRVVLWWAGFLLLTIVGERLELTRLVRLSRNALVAFLVPTGLFLAGLVLTEIDLDAGTRLTGASMLFLAVWLLLYDVARRTVRQTGLPRYIAACLLSGYVWLAVSGLLVLRFGALTAGPRYDAMLHAFFLGFVFAMIFGHAPIIFPAVLGVPITFRPTFYVHLVLLHLSLLVRIAGDVAEWWAGRRWGGLLNAVVLLLFLANTAYSALNPDLEPSEQLAAEQT